MPDREKAQKPEGPEEEPGEKDAGAQEPRRRVLQRRIVRTGFGMPNRLQTRVVSLPAGDEEPEGSVEVAPDMKTERAWRDRGPVSLGAPEFDGVPVVEQEDA
jgi:hypothetical protein